MNPVNVFYYTNEGDWFPNPVGKKESFTKITLEDEAADDSLLRRVSSFKSFDEIKDSLVGASALVYEEVETYYDSGVDGLQTIGRLTVFHY